MTNPDNVRNLMASSVSKKEWTENCNLVKAANGGDYPDFWFAAVIRSGISAAAESKFETSD